MSGNPSDALCHLRPVWESSPTGPRGVADHQIVLSQMRLVHSATEAAKAAGWQVSVFLSYVVQHGATQIIEPEFLNRLCEKADCGILLDVTNLYINSKNHGFDPRTWLNELNPERIVQLHVVGYSVRAGRWEDLHSEPIQDDLLGLIREVLAYAPVRAIIIERDSNFPEPEELAVELRKLEAALG